MKIFRIISEFRILRLTFIESQPENAEFANILLINRFYTRDHFILNLLNLPKAC